MGRRPRSGVGLRVKKTFRPSMSACAFFRGYFLGSTAGGSSVRRWPFSKNASYLDNAKGYSFPKDELRFLEDLHIPPAITATSKQVVNAPSVKYYRTPSVRRRERAG